jgi:hypothetical protein
MPESLLIPPRHQARSRRRAIRPRDVAAGESDAGRGECIQAGSGDVLAAVEADVGVSHVVAHDDEDVGLGLSQGGGGEGQKEREGEEKSHESQGSGARGQGQVVLIVKVTSWEVERQARAEG